MTLKLLMPSDDSTPLPMLASSLLKTNAESRKRKSRGWTMPTTDSIQIRIKDAEGHRDSFVLFRARGEYQVARRSLVEPLDLCVVPVKESGGYLNLSDPYNASSIL
jgi:hypothetical protein